MKKSTMTTKMSSTFLGLDFPPLATGITESASARDMTLLYGILSIGKSIVIDISDIIVLKYRYR